MTVFNFEKYTEAANYICKSGGIYSAHVRYGHRYNTEKKYYFHNNSMMAILNFNALWGVHGMAGKKAKILCTGFCEFLVGENPKTWNCLGGTVETTLRCPG